MSNAKAGDTVKIHYTGTLDDGTQFDSSAGRDPLEFELGGGQVIPGFEEAVVGMAVGEVKKQHIPMEQAYGPRNENMVLQVERDQLPKDMTPNIGDQLNLRQAEDQVITVIITELTDTTVTLDANHPLAGVDLNFNIELVEIV